MYVNEWIIIIVVIGMAILIMIYASMASNEKREREEIRKKHQDEETKKLIAGLKKLSNAKLEKRLSELEKKQKEYDKYFNDKNNHPNHNPLKNWSEEKHAEQLKKGDEQWKRQREHIDTVLEELHIRDILEEREDAATNNRVKSRKMGD